MSCEYKSLRELIRTIIIDLSVNVEIGIVVVGVSASHLYALEGRYSKI